ncbi:MAG TPA: hypothetical protein VMA74_04940 [Dyella sp.]|uniref:hypothetical protein n=1 Tax=Dyella sp. TaxID=1869338 RepID=UPI002B581ED9|nr:hypothetical protein [Dyella sp.]HUB89061.1 hypothetical protein [Dyella sp.]
MSIRNATIARRRRKIGLSEQERMTLDAARRRRGAADRSKRQDDGLPLKKADPTARWHATWAEG